MSHELIIHGGTVVTPEGTRRADVAIDGGLVTGVGDDLGDAHTRIDATDSWVGPGLVDLHTHLREPGHEWKEDVASGSAAAGQRARRRGSGLPGDAGLDTITR